MQKKEGQSWVGLTVGFWIDVPGGRVYIGGNS